MSIKFTPPASIEAVKANALARSVIIKKPQKVGTLGITFPFSFDRNSQIVIEEELSPKEAKVDPSSMLSKDDGLKGDAISGFTLRPLKPELVHGSHTHKASALSLNKFVYAKLVKSFKCLEGTVRVQLT